jgi:hypothetical protein
METSHVISALRRTRSELARLITDAERRLASLREAAASIDATIRLYDLGANPEDIKPKRPYKRRTSFARRELPRLVADEVRKASTPLSARAIAALIAAGKGIDNEDATIATQVSAALKAMLKRGAVARTGKNRAALWQRAP